jgi:hypothetical protein
MINYPSNAQSFLANEEKLLLMLLVVLVLTYFLRQQFIL